jgi:hypothetical protein
VRKQELRSHAEGGYGFGMKRQGLPVDRWIEVFHAWLEHPFTATEHVTSP